MLVGDAKVFRWSLSAQGDEAKGTELGTSPTFGHPRSSSAARRDDTTPCSCRRSRIRSSASTRAIRSSLSYVKIAVESTYFFDCIPIYSHDKTCTNDVGWRWAWICLMPNRERPSRQVLFHIPFTWQYYIYICVCVCVCICIEKNWCINILTVYYTINSPPGECNQEDFIGS